MSNLAERTEKKAVTVLAKAVLQFEKLRHLKMTSEDAFKAREAENLLRSVIESSEYRMPCNSKRA